MNTYRIAAVLVATQLMPGISLHAQVNRVATDFDGVFRLIETPDTSDAHITGALDPAFEENSSNWASVDARFEQIDEGSFQGGGALRVTLDSIRSGHLQIVTKPLAIESGAYGKIRFAARSPKSGQLELKIRMVGPPYQDEWRQVISLAPEWRVFEMLTSPLEPDSRHQYMFMVLFREGITEIDAFSLDLVSEEALVLNQEPKPGNLFRNTSFPFGLQRPWTTFGSLVGDSALADADVKGPTGQPALRVEPGYDNSMMPLARYGAIISPAITANSLSDHTVSFYARGSQPEQELEVQLSSDEYAWQSQSVTIKEEWDRYAVTMKTPVLVHGFTQVRIRSAETFWIDGVQLEEASTAGDFRRSDKVELILGSRDAYGLHVGDEPLSLRLAMLGEVDSVAYLSGKIEDAFGNRRPIERIDPASVDEMSQVEIPGIEGHPFGTFRISLRAHDEDGAPLSVWSEFVVHRIRPAHHKNVDIPDSPFGIHIKSEKAEAVMAKQLGFNWVRLHNGGSELIDWYFVEPEPGRLDFSVGDRGVDLLRKHNLLLLGTLDTSPVWYTNAGRSQKPPHWFTKYYIPFDEHLDEWAGYCFETVTHFDGRIEHWEIWNEPYVNFFFRHAAGGPTGIIAGTPEDYMKLLTTGYEAAKDADPETTIFFHDSDKYDGWHDAIVALDPYAYSDAVALHNYLPVKPYGLPDFVSYRQALSDGIEPGVLDGLVFWNTEGGPGGANLIQPYQHRLPENTFNTVTADYVVRYVLANLVAGIDKAFLYTYHTYSWYPGWHLLAVDGGLGPNASAMANMMWHLEDSSFDQVVEINEAYDAYIFDRGQKAVCVIVQKQLAHEAWGLPEGEYALRDLFGNDIEYLEPDIHVTSFLSFDGTANELKAMLVKETSTQPALEDDAR